MFISYSIIFSQSRDSIVCLANMHFLRCCALAERAFGRTHNATVALRARLGDVGSLGMLVGMLWDVICRAYAMH